MAVGGFAAICGNHTFRGQLHRRGEGKSRTHHSVNSVQLFGSWDNFSKGYQMERDSRRDRGQWRGCHVLENIIGDGKQKRSGLKMGEKYYYYYEVDGSTETHDPAVSSTNVCPYLPGQTVNTLELPRERSLRSRSASMTSLRPADFQTINPRDKFTTPRPAPVAPDSFGPRVGTAQEMQLRHKASNRSLSPAPSWTGVARRFLGIRPSSRSSDRGRSTEGREWDDAPRSISSGDRFEELRSSTPSEGTRSRDMSPESLRRFLSDDTPISQPAIAQIHKLTIPDIVEENEDDDNFATSAVSESIPFTTLSPPPFKRSLSSSSADTELKNESMVTVVPDVTPAANSLSSGVMRNPEKGFELGISDGQLLSSTTSSSVASPLSPHSNHNFSFFDDINDDDDFCSSVHDDSLESPDHGLPVANYSLPHISTMTPKRLTIDKGSSPLGAPTVVAGSETEGVTMENTALLRLSGVDSGLGDLVNELGWIAHAV